MESLQNHLPNDKGVMAIEFNGLRQLLEQDNLFMFETDKSMQKMGQRPIN